MSSWPTGTNDLTDTGKMTYMYQYKIKLASICLVTGTNDLTETGKMTFMYQYKIKLAPVCLTDPVVPMT